MKSPFHDCKRKKKNKNVATCTNCKLRLEYLGLLDDPNIVENIKVMRVEK